jgi:hypothetical protein
MFFSSIVDAVAPGLDGAGAVRWCGDLASRPTVSPCGLARPSTVSRGGLSAMSHLETVPRPACQVPSLEAAGGGERAYAVRGVTRPGGAPEAPASLAHGRCAPRLALGCRVRGRGPLRAPRAWGSGRSWDAENAPDTRGAGGPHSDVSTCLTSLLHRPSPGRSSPWEPQPGSARWRLDGAGRGERDPNFPVDM